MSNPKETGSFLEAFSQFLQFLQGLWAILAGVSVLFLLSNAVAGISFVVGLIALVLYITVHSAVANDLYFNVLGLQSDSLLRVIGGIVLLILYSAFFVLITQTFMPLAMVEYFGRKKKAVALTNGV